MDIFNFFAKVFTKYYFAQLIPNFFLTRVKYIFFLLKMDVTEVTKVLIKCFGQIIMSIVIIRAFQ